MATPSAAHAVLFNDDLFNIILEHTHRRDIPISRKRHLRRYKFVAGHEAFSRGVRELVWEAHAYGNGDIYEKKYLEMAPAARAISTGKDEDTLLEHRANIVLLIDELGLALARLKGLNHITITFWHGGEHGQRAFFNKVPLVKISPKMPPPVASLFKKGVLFKRQNQAFDALMQALRNTDLKIKAFTIAPGGDVSLPSALTICGPVEFPRMLIDFSTMDHTGIDLLAGPLEHLTSLRLDLSEKGVATSSRMALHRRLGIGNNNGPGLPGLLQRLSALKSIDIRIAPSVSENDDRWECIFPHRLTRRLWDHHILAAAPSQPAIILAAARRAL
ncbi:uncharacterized protein LTR77_004717 [Saxophila tyrrhenica]|uniref:Uncharacterized protein n=1 Tax=Saxophila tyrrhenica TaxID=1690608 RepID=A0AAV9PE28_9PEZI|nr:hypothetical protein LTR77_004717 [Saxophila tyrrhenica]